MDKWILKQVQDDDWGKVRPWSQTLAEPNQVVLCTPSAPGSYLLASYNSKMLKQVQHDGLEKVFVPL